MKILITGSDGLLGSELRTTFTDGFDVFACPRSVIDITDRQQVIENIRHIHPDVIIHAAAYIRKEKLLEQVAEPSPGKRDVFPLLAWLQSLFSKWL